ncbi:MAG: hypothetical protein ACOCRO_08505 [Halanaerobiales bacterium]
MEKCGYTTKEWKEDVSKEDKIGFIAKRQLEIERDKRKEKEIKEGRKK